MTLYTVGYEGCDIDEFLTFLKKNKITCIIDIRKNPVSRKKGFSKTKLDERLAEKKIAYVHFGSLGVPSAWRKEEKAHLITRRKMFSDYVRKVIPQHEKDILELMRVAKATPRAALLCYEADASDCHRHFLAEKINKIKKTKIVDLHIPSQKGKWISKPGDNFSALLG